METKHPMQPLEFDDYKNLRFKRNAIVEMLLDSHPTEDLKTLVANHLFSREDHAQFMQLIGYDSSSYEGLNCVTDEEADQVHQMAMEIFNLPKREWVDVGA